ncbi:MAG: PAS domain S-box protein [Bacteroidales bacterium]|nr:PAS domain S-box protein [Bacteroidales bacterium]
MKNISDEILNYLLDNADSMISIVNKDMRYVAVNEPFCKSFNMNKKDLVGKCPSELWGDRTYRGKIRKNLERSLKGEKIQYRAFFDISGSSGKFYEVTYRPFQSANTSLSYAIIETRDVSQEIQENEKLREKDVKYRLMEKYMPFGIFSCDREGTIIEANETFYNILEAGPENRKKLNFKELIRDDHRFTTHLNSGKTGEAGTFGQVKMLTPGGRELFVRISSYIRDDKQYGNIIDASLEDVTREVILERRLYQSQKLETLGTLTGGVAHDFNTILTTISGYSEMTMEEVAKDSVVHDYMARLKEAVDKAGNIINQMMIFSKQMDQHLVALELEKVLREALEFIHSSIPDNVSLETNYEKIRGLVYADPTQLFRVLLNIMTNALHAMEEKGGVMTVGLGCSSTDNKLYADISVSDTGTGIDPSIIDRIFEPFFTTKDISKGTGMGLAVSHGIITGIGGEINVESNPGKGSVFTLRIPMDEPEQVD